MEKLFIYTPDAYTHILHDLQKIPFAKVDDGYRFASWIYELNDTEKKRQEVIESPHGEDAIKLLEKAKADLSEVVVSEDDYLSWTVHKKNAGGVAQYHKIIQGLSDALLLLAIDEGTRSVIETGAHRPEEYFYRVSFASSKDDTKQVLNRNNPFADVTIKSQQFFYKTSDGDTETLFFNTNNVVEKVDRQERVMLTMHPGFSVTKEHGAAKTPMQKVTFASSLTEPIAGDEDHIYIHID